MYVIQYRTRGDGFKPGTWQPCCVGGVPKRYATLSEVRAAYDALPHVMLSDYRIAEEYTVTRYTPVNHPPDDGLPGTGRNARPAYFTGRASREPVGYGKAGFSLQHGYCSFYEETRN